MEHLTEFSCPVYQAAPYLAWHLGISDILIFLCYMLIPALLFTPIILLPKIASVFKVQGFLLGLFILSCGITHLIKPGLLFWNIWDIAVIANWICALCSILATLHLHFYARPKLILIIKAFVALMKSESKIEIENTLQILRELIA